MIYEAIIFLLFLIYFHFVGKKITKRLGYHLPAAFVLKFAVGLICTSLFSNLFGNNNPPIDADVYMHDSRVLFGVASQNFGDFIRLLFSSNDYLVSTYLLDTTHWDSSNGFLINDGRFILRFHALLHFISFGKVSIHLMVTNALALMGIYRITKSIGFVTRLPKLLCFYIFLLAPNFLFWTSSILKEPLIIYGIGLTLWSLVHVHHLWKKILFFNIGLFVIFNVKMYIGICLITAIFIYSVFRQLQYSYVKYGFIALILLCIGLLFTPVMKVPIEKISRIQFDFNNIGKGGLHARAEDRIYVIPDEAIQFLKVDGDSVYLTRAVEGTWLPPNEVGIAQSCTIQPNEKAWIFYDQGTRSNSYIPITLILNEPLQLIKNIPEALTIGLLRPFPTDPPNQLFKWFSVLDSVLIYAFLLYCIYYRRKLIPLEREAIIGFLVFIIFLALIIGWTTPVLGAVVRYRAPIQLAILCIGMILLDPKHIPSNYLKIFKNPQK